jgi:alpha-tubulin suppressor-like RCC1 family protein
MASSTLLAALLQDWRLLLTEWSLNGILRRAALEALRLPGEPEGLWQLIERWSAGEFKGLPSVVVLAGTAMPSAAGAYAIATNTIYLNADWLRNAPAEQLLDVLNEELGHYLDGLLNANDTPGDEGELVAALLKGKGVISEGQRLELLADDDHGSVWVAGQELAVEQAARVVRSQDTVRYIGAYGSQGEFINEYAYAALRGNGSVVTWGDPNYGGDSTAVASQLSSGVVQVFSGTRAFAALKRDGSVVTWGNPESGGEQYVYDFSSYNSATYKYDVRSSVAGQLASGVNRVFSSRNAFAVLKNDGSVVSWGLPRAGNSAGLALSSGVTSIASSIYGFAALKNNGSVVTWGSDSFDSSLATKLASGVTSVVSNDYAFAALKNDGSVVAWGDTSYGGSISWPSELSSLLASGVTRIYASSGAFAALKSNGSVVAWGSRQFGGFSSYPSGFDYNLAVSVSGGDIRYANPQFNVDRILSFQSGFAALKRGGSVVAWGYGDNDVSSSAIQSGLTQIVGTLGASRAYAGLRGNGSVITWGDPNHGGNSSSVASALSSGVTRIFSTNGSFAALKSDGSVVTWGRAEFGGESAVYRWESPYTATPQRMASVASQLSSGVTEIFSNSTSFSALKSDGAVVTWGLADRGGDSSSIATQLVDVVAFANPFTDDRLILDTELPAISLAISPAAVAEDGTANLIYTFFRSGPTSYSLSVNYTVGGTATPGTDYTGIETLGITKTVIFAAGSATAVISVDPSADVEIEANETVALSIAYGSAYTISTLAAVVGTIVNDDPAITLTVSPAGVTEDASTNLVYTFTRTGPTSSALTVNYGIIGTADSSDYTGATPGAGKTITFAAGSATATLTIDPTADTSIEADETVALTLVAGTGYTPLAPAPP